MLFVELIAITTICVELTIYCGFRYELFDLADEGTEFNNRCKPLAFDEYVNAFDFGEYTNILAQRV